MKITLKAIIPFILLLAIDESYTTYLRAAPADDTIIAASFSTSLAGQDDNVRRNIMVACRKLNGIKIPSHSVFSFNDAVGEGSSKNGFFPGRVLYRDSVAVESGGGLCQVSSTLFNALLMAGCVIIERHRHFQPVAYVPLGLDATIKYGKKDLRIRNPHPCALRIEAHETDSSLIVKITAEQRLKFRYEIHTEEDQVPVPSVDDADRIRQGISVLVYRKRYQGDTLIENALLYRDYYPPVYIR